MLANNSLSQEDLHLVSFYDNEENNQISVEPLREMARYYLSQGYGVIYGVEEFGTGGKNSIAKKIIETKDKLDILSTSSSTSPSTHNVNLQQSGKPKAMDKLMIIDPNSMYKENYKSSDIISYWLSQYSKASQDFGLENNNVKGIMGINIPDPYFEKKEFEKFLEFEEGIDRAFDGKIGLICWYKKKWLEELTLPQFVRMMISHRTVINNDLSIVKWDVGKILDIITKTIDSAAETQNNSNNSNNNKELKKDDKDEDNQTYSNLIFETIRNRYHLDRNSLVTNPEQFEDTFTKMLGKDSYEELSNNIKYNLVNEIFGYSNKLATS